MKTALPAAAATLDINVLNELLLHSKFLSAYAFEVVSCSTGECTVRAPYQPLLDRPGGIVSGLTYMGVADVAMWLAIMTLRGSQESWVTSDLKTAFLKSARQEDIFCSARVLRAGKRSMYGTADCNNAAGELLAHHVLSYAFLPDVEQVTGAPAPSATPAVPPARPAPLRPAR